MLRKVGLGLLAAVACVAMFDIPSAYAAARGAPWGLALAIGLLVFPVLPVAWHVWGERDKAKKRQTTKGERFALRTSAVAILAIGGLLAFARGPTWRAMRHHALWMLPEGAAGPIVIDGSMLRYLPPDADAVIWLDPSDRSRALLGKLDPDLRNVPRLVGALAGDEAVLLERGDTEIVESLAKILEGLKGLGAATPAMVQTTMPDGTKLWATPKAKVGTVGAPRRIVELLRGAQDDAFLVVVALGDHHDLEGATALRAEVSVSEDLAALSLDLFTDHPAAFKDKLERMIDQQAKKAIACLKSHEGTFDISVEGDHVTVLATIDADHPEALKVCFD